MMAVFIKGNGKEAYPMEEVRFNSILGVFKVKGEKPKYGIF